MTTGCFSIITENSIWTFNLFNKRYIRGPKHNDSTSTIPYTNKPEDFVDIQTQELFPDRLLIIRPVPYGQGQLRSTGIILQGRKELLETWNARDTGKDE